MGKGRSSEEIGDAIWGWQEQDDDGNWGLLAAVIPLLPEFGTTVLVTRQEHIAKEIFGPIAKNHSAKTGRRIRLAHFKMDFEVETT